MLRPLIFIPALFVAGCAVNSDSPSELQEYEVNTPVRAGAPGDVILAATGDALLGSALSIEVANAHAYEEVHIAVSLRGGGDGTCYPALGFLCLDINPPVKVLGSYWMDGEGMATVSFDIPDLDHHDGTEACFQAVTMRAGGAVIEKSNALCYTLDYDTDGDGLRDDDEIRAGSNPLIPDTDADGALDGEDCKPTDPLAIECTEIYVGTRCCAYEISMVDTDSLDSTVYSGPSYGYTGMTFADDGHMYGVETSWTPRVFRFDTTEESYEELGTLDGTWYGKPPGLFNLDGQLYIYNNSDYNIYQLTADDSGVSADSPVYIGSYRRASWATDSYGTVWMHSYDELYTVDVSTGDLTWFGTFPWMDNGGSGMTFLNGEMYILRGRWEMKRLYKVDLTSMDMEEIMDVHDDSDALAAFKP